MSSISILIIDDDIAVRNGLKSYLEDLEQTVDISESAENAQNMVELRHYDVIIVDLRLPGISGDEFIERFYEKLPETAFIIYTGSTNYEFSENMLTRKRISAKIFEKPLLDLKELWHEILIMKSTAVSSD